MDQDTRTHYTLLAEFLHKTLGSEYEVILFDLQENGYSIAYLANGHISGRNSDNLMVDEIFKFISNEAVSENDYIVSNQGIPIKGHVIRSSILFIKDVHNKLTGMLCINFNGSKYVNLAKRILQLTQMENASIESEHLHTFEFKENIPSSISDVTENIVGNALDFADIPIDRLNQEEKMKIVGQLNDKGVFMLKGSVSEVAEKLEVSEATLYRYIRAVSKEK